MNIRRIGILTSGGDCPGLNAVIRAVTKSAIYGQGWEVYGIFDGFHGLLTGSVRKLEEADVSNILTRGGTILGSNNRFNPVRHVRVNESGERVEENVMPQCLATLQRHEIDAMVVVGGDGSMNCAAHFVDAGVVCMGVPKTIDNDLEGTDVTFGFATAVNTATEALDRIHTTAASHHRVMLVEVMGRNAGWIALHAGLASGSDVILLPEIPYHLDVVADKIRSRRTHGKGFTIICVAEGATAAEEAQVMSGEDPLTGRKRLGGVSQQLAETLEQMVGFPCRATILGYTQRGGTPVPEDRLLGTMFGHKAVTLLAEGVGNRLVVQQAGVLTHVPILSVRGRSRTVPADHPLVAAARAVSTCFGDAPACE